MTTARFSGTIVFSIHQPRYSTFKLFDTILFLCKGISVYRGPATGVVPYFATQGYQCEMYDNPADFALDTLIDASRKPGELEKLDQAYRASVMHTSVVALLDKQSHDDDFERLRRQQQGAAARSIGAEIYYVAQRTLKNAIRNPQLLLAQTMMSIVLGLLVGLVFFNLQKTVAPGVQDILGTLFFIVMNQIFGTLSSLEPLLKERVLFIHVSLFRVDDV
jgi:ATP-binding cassette subfamily G (WHITE) protein 2